MLSRLLYSLFTHDCVVTHASNSIIKFTNDTTVVGLITNNDETAYREEASTESQWRRWKASSSLVYTSLTI